MVLQEESILIRFHQNGKVFVAKMPIVTFYWLCAIFKCKIKTNKSCTIFMCEIQTSKLIE